MDLIDRQAAIDVIKHVEVHFTVKSTVDFSAHKKAVHEIIDHILDAQEKALSELPLAESEWNNHTVACLLADMFDDPCACNYNGIDEWLPEKCEVIDACPNPVGVACWEQFLTYRKERG